MRQSSGVTFFVFWSRGRADDMVDTTFFFSQPWLQARPLISSRSYIFGFWEAFGGKIHRVGGILLPV